MNEVRESIRAIMPTRMSARPVDHRGYPVPFFVTERDAEGRWDFRVLNPHRVVEAIKKNACWICGNRLGQHVVFAVGPMCGINRTSAEPPSHLECAEFAVRACPFMLLPKAKRREAGLPPDGAHHPSAILRNPGVMLLWSTSWYRLMRTDHGILIHMGDAARVTFWREGRPATRAEIDESVLTGLPALRNAAAQEGQSALDALARMCNDFNRLLPAA